MQHGLVLKKSHRVGDQTVKVNLAENQRTRTRIVHQAAQRDRNAPGAFNALLDFTAFIALRIVQFEFEMKQNSQQWIIDLVGRAQCQLREGSILLVFR